MIEYDRIIYIHILLVAVVACIIDVIICVYIYIYHMIMIMYTLCIYIYYQWNVISFQIIFFTLAAHWRTFLTSIKSGTVLEIPWVWRFPKKTHDDQLMIGIYYTGTGTDWYHYASFISGRSPEVVCSAFVSIVKDLPWTLWFRIRLCVCVWFLFFWVPYFKTLSIGYWGMSLMFQQEYPVVMFLILNGAGLQTSHPKVRLFCREVIRPRDTETLVSHWLWFLFGPKMGVSENKVIILPNAKFNWEMMMNHQKLRHMESIWNCYFCPGGE